MKWSCTDAASCEGVGGQFNENPWGGHCEEPCSKTNLWSCKDAASCSSAGGEMASPPWCPDCPGNCNAPCSAYIAGDTGTTGTTGIASTNAVAGTTFLSDA